MKHLENVEVYATKTVRVVKSWLQRAGFTLVDEKTEAGIVTNTRKKSAVKVRVGGHTGDSKLAIKGDYGCKTGFYT